MPEASTIITVLLLLIAGGVIAAPFIADYFVDRHLKNQTKRKK